MNESALAGRRVLVVEDDYLLADALGTALRMADVVVFGPVPTVEDALDLLSREMPDAAVLDVNLGGTVVDEVADLLLARGVPVLFTTGYDLSSLPKRFAAVRWLEKPVERSALLRELAGLLAA